VGIWNADAAKAAQEHMDLCAQHLRGIEQRRRVSGGMLMTSSLRESVIKDLYKQFTLDAMERGMAVVSRTQVQYCRTRFPGPPLAAAEEEVWTFKPPTLDTYDTVELRVQGLAIPIHKATEPLE
jgi:hypothetical protein